MTICIDNRKLTLKREMASISGRDSLLEQVVRAWDRSGICHCFENEKLFKRAVERNQRTLESPDKIGLLFHSRKYLFSTKTEDSEETLYFASGAATGRLTGRLRQQHRKGPLAKIDKRARTRRFVSEKRFRFLKAWHDEHRCRVPRFYPYEERPETGKRHIEFARDGRTLARWHESRGIVERSRQDIDHRICKALKEILGWTPKRSTPGG